MSDQQTPPKAKTYPVGRLEGGELPELGKLVGDTVAEFGDNFAPYLLAGLGLYLTTLPAAFVGVFASYALAAVAYVVVAVLGGVLGAALERANENLGALVLAGTQLVALALALAVILGVVVLLIAAMGPLGASLYRAVAAHQRGEGTLELQSAFRTATQNPVPVITVNLAVVGLAMVGVFLCYVPSLAVMAVFPFATALVAIGGLGAREALAKSWSHATSNLSWYVVFAIAMFVANMIGAYIPVIGPAFLVALHVRAYRHVFGDPPVQSLESAT